MAIPAAFGVWGKVQPLLAFVAASLVAADLAPIILTPPRKRVAAA